LPNFLDDLSKPFDVSWNFPRFETPEHARQLSPRCTSQKPHMSPSDLIKRCSSTGKHSPSNTKIGSQLAGVQEILKGLLVDRPRLNIIRRTKLMSNGINHRSQGPS
jgi:hypothetical protein